MTNPNLLAPPFVDGSPLPASGLNRAFSATGPGLNILAFGGNNTGGGDNTAAFAAAIAASPNHALIYFPPGKYVFLSRQLVTMPNVALASLSIVGCGPDVTELTWPNAAGGIAITLQTAVSSVHVRDLTLSTGVVSGGTALSITGPSNISGQYYFPISDVSDVAIRGSDGFAVTNYWTIGVLITSVSWLDFYDVTVCGPLPSVSSSGQLYAASSGSTGIQLVASVTAIGIVYNFHGCNFSALTNGLLMQQWVQGVTVTQCNFTGCYVGIGVPGSQAGTEQLTVNSSQFNVYLNGVLDSSGVANLDINNSLFIIPSTGTGISLVGLLSNVNGNNFNAITNGTGVGVAYAGSITSDAGRLSDNVFWQLATAISITSGVVGLDVSRNSMWSVTTNIANAAAAGNNSIRGCGPFNTRPNILTTTISAAASGTGGVIRLTVGSSAGFVNDAQVIVQVVTGSLTNNLVGLVSVVDMTHVEIVGSTFVGTCTGVMTLLQ